MARTSLLPERGFDLGSHTLDRFALRRVGVVLEECDGLFEGGVITALPGENVDEHQLGIDVRRVQRDGAPEHVLGFGKPVLPVKHSPQIRPRVCGGRIQIDGLSQPVLRQRVGVAGRGVFVASFTLTSLIEEHAEVDQRQRAG
jgi:hypothetical protein